MHTYFLDMENSGESSKALEESESLIIFEETIDTGETMESIEADGNGETEEAEENGETEQTINAGELQQALYKLVPITEYESSNFKDDEELKLLLKSWDCLHMYEYLIGENVSTKILKIIKEVHVKSLLAGFKHGDRILFEYHLEKWRDEIGMPLLPGNEPLHPALHSTPPSPSTSNRSSRTASPTPSPEPDKNLNINLSVMLSAKKHGHSIVEYYNTHKKFQTEHRQLLIGLVAEYFEENSIPLTLKTSYRIEREILDRFPTEKLEYYRTEKRGKIYTKLHNIKRLYKTLEPKRVKTSPTKEVGKSNKPILIPEPDAQACVKSLNFDNLSVEEFDSVWDACAKHRLLQIQALSTQQEIFKAWPQYKNLNGYRLIDRDFKALHPESQTICENWERNFKTIKEFLIENLKDKKTTEMLNEFENSDAEKGTHYVCYTEVN
ncbi:uncharacterized protein LOC129947587 isoform X1 [Eupeodes corollae]|uniref:uncharacterized protein LOC129947587 isoform X1 n=2 Tax=Eupeodes corollae TaxID=290404 RepID=UPI002493C9C5|nr:uncharacterized protein LOC129947587 isoform X1 [Eupeodes corollae]